jgi:high-affinity nickel-transport protein
VGNLDFGLIGLAIIGIFVISWSVSTLIYRRKHYDDLPVAGRLSPRSGG